ncbi:MAG: SpoIIE family protein phosphatase [Bacteroidales bacterium]|nr:SpoIIE family protein phosphatase [Bacteroidales bacterium]
MRNEKTIVNIVRRSKGTGLMLIVVALVTLEVTSLVQFYYTQKGIREEATMRAESQLEMTRSKIMDVVNQAEAAVRNSVWIASWCLDYPDSLPVIPRRLVEDNPTVVGSTLALVPGFDKKHPLVAPYAVRTDDGIRMLSLATESYDYPTQEWFTRPLELEAGYWSEPYIDTGGGEMLMTTYSLPIRDARGQISAVLTADISLDWLTEMLGGLEVYPNAFNVVLSRSGRILVCPAETLVMRRTVQEFSSTITEDRKTFDSLMHAMLAGQDGNLRLQQGGRSSQVYFAPVERTGWSMSVVIPEYEIYGGVRRVALMVVFLQLLGLLMLLLILRASIRDQEKYKALSDREERMEQELQIGRDIQMSMVPKIFPSFPARRDIDMSGSTVPAKEVGGDLYDFFISSDLRLYFCIGDVSGKGVPASLLMAVTRSLFRSISAHEKSPQRIVSLMNESLSDMNENNMFVTLFCGVIDLNSGHFRYCNAGHNPPMLVSGQTCALNVVPNLPLGVADDAFFQEQEMDLSYNDTIFLYTDGLTEAENLSHEQFGEKRMCAVLQPDHTSVEQVAAMQAAVAEFVGDAEQSDDLTMLSIRYLNDSEPDMTERHLILHNNIQQIPQLAEFVETIADEMHLDQGLAMGLNLALEEAVTNVILYAYPEGSDGLVDIEAIMRHHSLEFIITDSGIAFDPTAAPEADTTLGVEDRPIGGLGIYLVRNIMDTVTYERQDGKNILSMTKKI